MKIKRMLAIVLALALLIAAVPCTVMFAETAAVSGDVLSMDNYVLYNVYDSATATVSGSGPYTYGMFWRTDLPINTTGVAMEDLAVQFSIYYADSESRTSNAFWE